MGIALQDHQIQTWRGARRLRTTRVARVRLRLTAAVRPKLCCARGRRPDMDLSLTMPEGSPSRPMKQVISVLPTQSLLEAASLLIGNRIHRIPVIDRKTVRTLPPPLPLDDRKPAGPDRYGRGDVQYGSDPMSITPSSVISGAKQRPGAAPTCGPDRTTLLTHAPCSCNHAKLRQQWRRTAAAASRLMIAPTRGRLSWRASWP